MPVLITIGGMQILLSVLRTAVFDFKLLYAAARNKIMLAVLKVIIQAVKIYHIILRLCRYGAVCIVGQTDIIKIKRLFGGIHR